MDKEEQIKIFEFIIKKSYEDVDILASYQHYLIFGEIKVIYKTDKKELR